MNKDEVSNKIPAGRYLSDLDTSLSRHTSKDIIHD